MDLFMAVTHELGDVVLGAPGTLPADLTAEQLAYAEFIRHRRLDRCRRDLLDPEHDSRPVAAVGARWGLVDAAHFSRAFKREYGVPPAAFRAGHGPAQA